MNLGAKPFGAVPREVSAAGSIGVGRRFIATSDRVASKAEPLRWRKLELGERVLPPLHSPQPDLSADGDWAPRARTNQTLDSGRVRIGSASGASGDGAKMSEAFDCRSPNRVSSSSS